MLPHMIWERGHDGTKDVCVEVAVRVTISDEVIVSVMLISSVSVDAGRVMKELSVVVLSGKVKLEMSVSVVVAMDAGSVMKEVSVVVLSGRVKLETSVSTDIDTCVIVVSWVEISVSMDSSFKVVVKDE